MELNIPILALIVASTALLVSVTVACIAFSNYRRSNYSVLRIENCECSYPRNIRENNGQPFCQFRVLVRNLGIPLSNVGMVLVFSEKNGAGSLSYPLKRNDQANGPADQFSKGMIAEFYIKSYQLSNQDRKFLMILEDLPNQFAKLCFVSGGHVTTQWKVGSFWDRCKQGWNRLALSVNCKATREIGRNQQGLPIIRQYTILPTFRVLGWYLSQFIKALRVSDSESASAA